MKKYFYKFLLFAFLITYLSCTEEENINKNDHLNTEIPAEIAQIDTQNPIYQKILEMGFSPNYIKEYNDYYLVEGDISFPKDIASYGDEYKVNDYKSGVKSRHAHTDNLIQLTDLKIYVYIDPSIPNSGVDNWRPAINLTLNDWNSISNFGVHFVLTSFPSSANITITSDYGTLPDNIVADALFPTSTGKPGNRVRINLNNYSNYNDSQRRYIIVHELGHCIGFRHTNWETNDGGSTTYGANLIPGTPNVDNQSVMNGSTGGSFWNGFSYYDLIASRYLYPYALKWNYVNAFEENYPDDKVSEDDVYLNVYTDASYTTPTTLPSAKTLIYNFTTNHSAPDSYFSRYSSQKNLSPGSTQYYINTVRSECSYDYGVPQTCYEQYLEFTSLN